jgi:nitrate reductase delta subunit
MNADQRLQAKLLSACLRFPDEDLLRCLNDLHRKVGQHASASAVFSRFLPRIHGMSLIRLQEEYTQTFDLGTSTCMNMTHHQCGKSRKRGEELVRLKQIFREEGLEPAAKELPDFLPMLLEFLSVCSDDSADAITRFCRREVVQLARRLAEAQSSYAGVFELVARLFEEQGG